MTRILLDQGLPRSAAELLRAANWEVVHAQEIGLATQSDAEIIQYARNEQRVIVTLDADFHALLAVSGSNCPSVVRIRREGLRGLELSNLLMQIWPGVAAATDSGAVVTVTDSTVRIRRLPIIRALDSN